ncbi:MAG: urease subunit gamma [Solirubrobacteraceae bacterium]
MRLLPREQDRLLLFLAAELARKRRARGLRLNQAEAIALIADEVCEAARDGRAYADAEAAGYAALGPADVADGVAELVRRVEVEALFADGSRLLVLHDPIGPARPRPYAETGIEWLAEDVALSVVNEGEVPVGVTSHFHFFEVNRALRFERAAAWGMRLAIAPGAKVFFDPGSPHAVFLVPFGGARVVRGHAGLADGSLDADGARDAALGLARERGYRGA